MLRAGRGPTTQKDTHMAQKSTTAREKMLAYVVEHGWTLDPGKTIPVNRYDYDNRKQDPYSFVKPAAHGGTWHVTLDYTNHSSGGYSGYRTGNLLNHVVVSYRNAEGEPEPKSTYASNGNIGTLKNTDRSKYSVDSMLWKALGPKEWVEKPPSITARAKLLFSDPDLAVWLALQTAHEDKVARDTTQAAIREDRKLRNRLLPVTVDQDGYYSDWKKLAHKLVGAAKAVESADGKSDLHQLVADAIEALADVMNVIKDKEEDHEGAVSAVGAAVL